MKHTLNLLALVFLVAALILGITTNSDTENEGELVKALRDPDRVDKRWVYVTSLATAAVCLGMWAASEKRK
jgi:hypothetical protein